MFKIVKKPEPSPRRAAAMRIGAILAALVLAAVIMAILGYDPFEVYKNIIVGSLKSGYRLRETINKAIPLTVLSLGISVAFKMKFWNIGGEGQFYMGAYGAALVAFALGDTLAAFPLLALMFIVGFAFGGIWGTIPALLRSKFNTSETLVTLMLNYIAMSWISHLQYGPRKDPAAQGFPKIATFAEAAILPKVFGIHMGWIIALVLAAVIHVMLKYSKLGYEISVLGESETTARYAGMNVARILITAVFISGGLCGAAGMMQASAIEHSLSDAMSGGLGFTAVITTWLAQLSAPAIVVVSFAFSMLLQGGSFLQSAMKISSSVSDVLQATIIFFVLGSEFFLRYSIEYRKKDAAAGE